MTRVNLGRDLRRIQESADLLGPEFDLSQEAALPPMTQAEQARARFADSTAAVQREIEQQGRPGLTAAQKADIYSKEEDPQRAEAIIRAAEYREVPEAPMTARDRRRMYYEGVSIKRQRLNQAQTDTERRQVGEELRTMDPVALAAAQRAAQARPVVPMRTKEPKVYQSGGTLAWQDQNGQWQQHVIRDNEPKLVNDASGFYSASVDPATGQWKLTPVGTKVVKYELVQRTTRDDQGNETTRTFMVNPYRTDEPPSPVETLTATKAAELSPYQRFQSDDGKLWLMRGTSVVPLTDPQTGRQMVGPRSEDNARIGWGKSAIGVNGPDDKPIMLDVLRIAIPNPDDPTNPRVLIKYADGAAAQLDAAIKSAEDRAKMFLGENEAYVEPPNVTYLKNLKASIMGQTAKANPAEQAAQQAAQEADYYRRKHQSRVVAMSDDDLVQAYKEDPRDPVILREVRWRKQIAQQEQARRQAGGTR